MNTAIPTTPITGTVARIRWTTYAYTREEPGRNRAGPGTACGRPRPGALDAPDAAGQFFSMFQKNGTGETSTPESSLRQATGWNHCP